MTTRDCFVTNQKLCTMYICCWYVPISFKFIWFFIISMVELQIAIKSSKKLYFLDHKNDWWVQIYDKYANTSLQLPFWNGFLYNKILKVCTVGDVMRSGFFQSLNKKNSNFLGFSYSQNNSNFWSICLRNKVERMNLLFLKSKNWTTITYLYFDYSVLQKHPRAFFSYLNSIYVLVLLLYDVVVEEEGGGCIITFLAFFQKYHRNINTKKYKSKNLTQLIDM